MIREHGSHEELSETIDVHSSKQAKKAGSTSGIWYRFEGETQILSTSWPYIIFLMLCLEERNGGVVLPKDAFANIDQAEARMLASARGAVTDGVDKGQTPSSQVKQMQAPVEVLVFMLYNNVL